MLTFYIGYAGICQGVIALNMEDGTLHRFQASSTILATGVHDFLLLVWHLSFFYYFIPLIMDIWGSIFYYIRVTVEHTFLQPQHIHALVMAMPWLLVLGSHLRFLLLFSNFNFKMISHIASFLSLPFSWLDILFAGSRVCAISPNRYIWSWLPYHRRLVFLNLHTGWAYLQLHPITYFVQQSWIMMFLIFFLEPGRVSRWRWNS